MSLPQELEKPIEKINNPILQVLIIGAVLIIIALSSAVVYYSRTNDNNYKQENTVLRNDNAILRQKIEDMYRDAANKSEEEKQRLRTRDHYFDSVLISLDKLKKNVQ